MGELIIAFLILCSPMGDSYDLAGFESPSNFSCYESWMNNSDFQSFMQSGDYEALPGNLQSMLQTHIQNNYAVYNSVNEFLKGQGVGDQNSGDIIFIDDTAD